jgi:outer membrane receptor for ferrienterochelin and colicin
VTRLEEDSGAPTPIQIPQVTQAGGRGGHAALSLRGLDPNHVIVLIDGVRLSPPARDTRFAIRDFADYRGTDITSPWCSDPSTTMAG